MIVRHFCTSYVPSLRDGLSRNVDALVRALERAGEDVQFDAAPIGRAATTLQQAVENHKLLLASLRDPRTDVAHQHIGFAATAALAQLARWRAKTRVPLVLHVWNPIHRTADAYGAAPFVARAQQRLFNNRAAARLALHGAAAVVASSEFQARQIFDAGYDGPMFVIPNGVDTRAFRPATFLERALARQDLGVADAEVVALYHGSLQPWAGIETLLHALPTFFQQRPSAKLIIAHTSGPSREQELLMMLRRQGIADRVVFQAPYHVPTLLAASDIAIVPPIAPVGGICHPAEVLEALASGVAVVASRVGSIPEAVEHNRTGILFRPGDSDELARKLLLLASDRSLRQSLGSAGRVDALSRFHWDTVAYRLRETYELVVEAGLAGLAVTDDDPSGAPDPVARPT